MNFRRIILSSLFAICSLLLLFVSLPKTASGATAPDAPFSGSPIIGQLSGDFQFLSVVEPYVYLISDKNLSVVDASNPTTPIQVGSLAGTDFHSLAVQGDYAYIIGTIGLYIVDISTPADPTLVSHLDVVSEGLRTLTQIKVSGAYAHIATRICPPHQCVGEVWIVDISDPSSPQVLTSYNGTVSDFAIDEELAYHAWYSSYYGMVNGGVVIYDVNDPLSVTLLSRIDVTNLSTLPYVTALAVTNQHAYLGLPGSNDAPPELAIYNIVDPRDPQLVDYFTMTLTAPYMWIDQVQALGDAIYFSSENELWVLDVHEPAHPQVIGYYASTQPLPSDYLDIPPILFQATADYIYILTNEGLQILGNQGLQVQGKVADYYGTSFPTANLTISPTLSTSPDEQGNYAFSGLPALTYTLHASLPGYAFWPAQRTLSLPPSACAQDFTVLAAPITTTLAPSVTASLLYTDTQSLPTRLELPASSVLTETLLTLTPELASSGNGLRFTGHAFELSAPETSFTFSQPLTLTIAYGPADLQAIRSENDMMLAWWNGDAWVDAAQTCAQPGEYQRNLDQNLLNLPICRSGHYALFGPTWQAYLPLVARPGAAIRLCVNSAP